MDIHALPGVGYSPNGLWSFKKKNVRIIDNLDDVAGKIFSSINKTFIKEPWTYEIDSPFPYENGLAFFVRVLMGDNRDGYFLCLTGHYRKRWLWGLTEACGMASTIAIGVEESCTEQFYIGQVKKFLELT